MKTLATKYYFIELTIRWKEYVQVIDVSPQYIDSYLAKSTIIEDIYKVPKKYLLGKHCKR